MAGKLRDGVIRGQRLHQKVADTAVQEPVRLTAVELAGGKGGILGRGAQVREYIGVEGCRFFPGQAAGGADDVLRQALVSLCQVNAHGEGVGLDGPASGFQIGMVDGPDLLRMVQTRLFTPLLRPAGQGGEPGAHGTVEQQGTALLQITSDVHYPKTFLAISTDWRASFA